MSNVIAMQGEEFNLTIGREAIDLLLWAKRHPEAAAALVNGEAAVVNSAGARLDGDAV